MNKEALIAQWRAEETIAHIHGWDFSHIEGRFEEELDFPWDYEDMVRKYLRADMRLLDIDTGGGEVLLSLGHPYANTCAIEAFAPNVALCRDKLLPLGIDFREGTGQCIPFDDASLDMVINRHGAYDAGEIARVLKPGGLFITQQVGAENDRELVKLLQPELEMFPFSEQYRAIAEKKFRDAGFDIVESDECWRTLRFFDIGALVWFARIIQWEFIDFSVDRCLPQLLQAQALLEAEGSVAGRTHRFMLVACKKAKKSRRSCDLRLFVIQANRAEHGSAACRNTSKPSRPFRGRGNPCHTGRGAGSPGRESRSSGR